MPYSEFYVHKPMSGIDFADIRGCECCGLTDRYLNMLDNQYDGHICSFCRTYKKRKFKGLDKLKYDVALEDGEKLGVTVSGGKDSIYLWGLLADIFGKENVVAFNHHKENLVDEAAVKNLENAKKILGTELVVINDSGMYERFRKNLALLIKNPNPALVRVVLCSGCRYGITERLYKEGEKRNIKKYVSGASYLELAPFKEQLIEKIGGGNMEKGFENLLQCHIEYDYGDNMKHIVRDSLYKYKGNEANDDLKLKLNKYQLFDMDEYVENNPEQIERIVTEKYGWQRGESSWHFDCMVEKVKNMFYYGMLGYTEADFKLAAMVRHGIIPINDAKEQIVAIREQLSGGYEKMRSFFVENGLESSLVYLDKFYKDSKYLKTHC